VAQSRVCELNMHRCILILYMRRAIWAPTRWIRSRVCELYVHQWILTPYLRRAIGAHTGWTLIHRQNAGHWECHHPKKNTQKKIQGKKWLLSSVCYPQKMISFHVKKNDFFLRAKSDCCPGWIHVNFTREFAWISPWTAIIWCMCICVEYLKVYIENVPVESVCVWDL